MTPRIMRTSKLQFWDEWVLAGKPPMVLVRLGRAVE